MAHGVNALNAYDEITNEELFQASYFDRLKEFSGLNRYVFDAFISFDQKTMKAGALSVKEKELIAIAVAHVTGPYCIQVIAAEPPFLLESLYHLTESLIHNGKLQEASNHVAEGLQLATKLQNQDFIHRYNVLIVTHFEVGEIEGKLSQAVHYFLDNEKDHDIPVYAKLLANYYESISNFEEANHYNKIALAIMEKKN
ncbi:carboxymuconolactone decarboxylase family protein [Terribacillus saccharophilus]|uniref:carboxymuconolactone decarboxylase family protein n=1 Tax=Terribacillus saccharophilus TaxID=361277 RepID=UPI00211BE45F|nr:carboxymuconolactone decarboxylase family protein [Terribacillus saccharophilus]